jgi:hypothetical protein
VFGTCVECQKCGMGTYNDQSNQTVCQVINTSSITECLVYQFLNNLSSKKALLSRLLCQVIYLIKILTKRTYFTKFEIEEKKNILFT